METCLEKHTRRVKSKIQVISIDAPTGANMQFPIPVDLHERISFETASLEFWGCSS
jgi:hypothetical protein